MEKSDLPPPPLARLVKTALHQAVLDVRLHQVRLLVARHGARVDCRDVHGRTPLMLACMIDNEERGLKMASILLKAGAYLNARDSLGRTALSYACLNAREAIVSRILKEDILDINEPDNDGNTPLHLACVSGNPVIVRMLAETFARFGLRVDARNKLGYTPLLLACKNCNYVSAYTLLTLTKTSPALRDNEFRLSAREWIQRPNHRQKIFAERTLLCSAPVSLHPPHTLSFSREYTMYQRSGTVLRPSFGTPRRAALRSSHPAGSWPPGEDGNDSRSEIFIGRSDARQMLLDAIDDFENKQGLASGGRVARGRFSHPPTAKLLAASRRGQTDGVPADVVALFKIYSEQYQPDCHPADRFAGLAARGSRLPHAAVSRRADKVLHFAVVS